MHVQVCLYTYIVPMMMMILYQLGGTCSGNDPLPFPAGAHSLCLFLDTCHILDVSRHYPSHSDPATVCSCPGAKAL